MDSSTDIIAKARAVAVAALEGRTRSDGSPFIGHPDAVARIVQEEIGLPDECVAAVYLHEAMRGQTAVTGNGETEGKSNTGIVQIDLKGFDEGIVKMAEGLNRISTIKPKDTRLEAENYKKLIIQYSTDPRVTVLKLADRLEIMRSLKFFPKADRERKILETLMLYLPLAHQLGLYNM